MTLLNICAHIPEDCHAKAAKDPVDSIVDDQELEAGAHELPHGEGQSQDQELNPRFKIICVAYHIRNFLEFRGLRYLKYQFLVT